MNTTVYEIQMAQSTEQILACFDLLKVLRPHIQKEGFVERIRTQETEGFHLAFISDDDGVKSVAGYRVATFLAWGKVLYIDDLITSPEARGIGFGTHLLKWLKSQATALGCDGMHLDAGINGVEAHRLYLNMGLKINCLHLSMDFE